MFLVIYGLSLLTIRHTTLRQDILKMETKLKILKITACVATIMAASSVAHAQDITPYVNVGAEGLDFEGMSGNIVARVGADISQYFGVEGEGSVGVLEDNDDFKIDYKIAGYGKVQFPATDQVNIFARVGYYKVEADLGEADGMAYGGGLEYLFTDRDGVRFDYTKLDDTGGSADTYSIVYSRRF